MRKRRSLRGTFMKKFKKTKHSKSLTSVKGRQQQQIKGSVKSKDKTALKELEKPEPKVHKESKLPDQVQVGGKVLKKVKTDLIEAYVYDTGVPTVTEDDLPALRWTGGKIPVDELRKALSFLTWVYKEYNTEGTTRLHYNECTKTWRVIVLPQWICTGLSAKEKDTMDDKTKEELTKLGASGFDTFGSGHSHCAASAFQSGIDETDEKDDVGFHYTLGCLDKDIADFHARFSQNKVIYRVNVEDWIDGSLNEILSLKDLPDFPEEWKTRMEKKVVSTHTTRGFGRSSFYGAGYASGGTAGYPYVGGYWDDYYDGYYANSGNRTYGKTYTPFYDGAEPTKEQTVKYAIAHCDYFDELVDDATKHTTDLLKKARYIDVDLEEIEEVIKHAVFSAVLLRTNLRSKGTKGFGYSSYGSVPIHQIITKVMDVLNEYNPAFELLVGLSETAPNYVTTPVKYAAVLAKISEDEDLSEALISLVLSGYFETTYYPDISKFRDKLSTKLPKGLFVDDLGNLNHILNIPVETAKA